MIVMVMMIVGFVYLLNYLGISYMFGIGVVLIGVLFLLVFVLFGWIVVFLFGSDMLGNVLFGNL